MSTKSHRSVQTNGNIAMGSECVLTAEQLDTLTTSEMKSKLPSIQGLLLRSMQLCCDTHACIKWEALVVQVGLCKFDSKATQYVLIHGLQEGFCIVLWYVATVPLLLRRLSTISVEIGSATPTAW